MRLQEFMGKFLMGDTFYDEKYGMIKPTGIPDNSGNVNVYLCNRLSNEIININDLDENREHYIDLDDNTKILK